MINRKLSILNRVKSPTPDFFKKLRNIGLFIAGVSAVILTAPVTLPTIVTTIAGYLTVASGVLSAISQTAVKHE